MPFIDDDLLWCPDNDGKMVDLTQCLQEAANGAQQQQQQQQQQNQNIGNTGLGELSQSDLTGLVSSLDEDTEEDLFKQLGESTFELDNFFTDFEDKRRRTTIMWCHQVEEGAQHQML
jgi:E74-like factor 1/2/4